MIPCDPQAVAQVADAVHQVAAEQHSFVVAAGLAEACPSAPFAARAAELSGVFPSEQAIIDAQLAIDDPAGWVAACAGGHRVLAEMISLVRSDQRRYLFEGCGLAARGWFTAAEWSSADGLIVLPLLAGATLAKQGIPADQVRLLVRAGAGIDGVPSTEPPPMMPYLSVSEPSPEEAGLLGVIREDSLGSGGLGLGAGGDDLGGIGGLGVRDRPSFDAAVQPDWSRAARKAGGSCTVAVVVGKQGQLVEALFEDCPEALRPDVQRALEASTYTPRHEDGAPARGRFVTTFTVQ